ncbi:hypothetical protein ScPMuIL_009877 [Solemya velum]
MFAKLKKKIQDEGGSVSDNERSFPSFPSFPGHASPLRRESGATVHSPLPKTDADSGISSVASPSSQASDASSERIEGSKEDILSMLLKRTDQCEQLKSKMLESNSIIKEKNRTIEKLEKALEKQQDGKYIELFFQLKENEEINKKLEDYEKNGQKLLKGGDKNSLHGADSPELVSTKKMLVSAQRELAESKTLLTEKEQKLKLSEKSLKDLENEVTKLQEKVQSLEAQCQRLQEDTSNHESLVQKLNNEKVVLEQTVETLNTDLIQKNRRLSLSESARTDMEGQHATLLRNSEIYRNKTTKLLDEKDEHVNQLQDRIQTLEQRLKDTSLSGDEQTDALQAERRDLEKKLSETRHQLAEIKTSWSDKISHLEEQIAHLNGKIVEDSEELANSEKANEQIRDNFHRQIESMKKKLENTEKQLFDNMELASSKETHFEKETNQMKTELNNKEMERIDLETQLRGKISSLESQLLSLETAKEHEKNLSSQRISQLQEREQEYIDNELKMEKKLEKYEEELGGLKTQVFKKSQECEQLTGTVQGNSALEDEFHSKISALEELMRTAEEKSDMYQKSSKTFQHSLQECTTEKDQLMLRNAELSQHMAAQQRKFQDEKSEMEQELTERLAQLHAVQERVADLQAQTQQYANKIGELEKDRHDNHSTSSTNTKLQQQLTQLKEEIAEKNKAMKKQELRLTDLKKTLQRELRVQALPNDEMCDARGQSSTPPMHRKSPATKLSPQTVRKTCRTPSPTQFHIPPHTDNSFTKEIARKDDCDIQSALEKDINFKYLKHVILKFMLSRESEALQLIRAISVLLRFTVEEQELIRDTLEYKMSWFGARPSLGRGQNARIIPPSY